MKTTSTLNSALADSISIFRSLDWSIILFQLDFQQVNLILRPSSLEKLDNKIPLDIFSIREREVIAELLKELTSKEISNKLFISGNTVETHRGRIFKKAGVSLFNKI